MPTNTLHVLAREVLEGRTKKGEESEELSHFFVVSPGTVDTTLTFGIED